MVGSEYSKDLGGCIKALRQILELGEKGELPTEIRLKSFGDWLRDHQPPWDISRELRIPDWVKPIYEGLWFRNTEFILPAFTRNPGSFRQIAALSLETHVVSFLDRLCSRQSAQPTQVTVEVVVDLSGNLTLSQDFIRRLLLVSYHLGARKELLNGKIVVNTHSHRGNLEANEVIANPLKARLRNECLIMRNFREGSMNMTQAYDSIGRVYNSSNAQGFPPENVVAAILSENLAWSQIYRQGLFNSQKILHFECRKFVKDVEKKEKEKEEEEKEGEEDDEDEDEDEDEEEDDEDEEQ